MKSKSALPAHSGWKTLLPALALLAPVLGAAIEPWGVSNNVRPSLRAPRFDEAAFKVPADARDLLVVIQVAR